jgi:lysozyme family protein
MKQTYDEAMQKVFADEGGYTNEAADPGGPTNWGITIFDARLYWKKNARKPTANGWKPRVFRITSVS